MRRRDQLAIVLTLVSTGCVGRVEVVTTDNEKPRTNFVDPNANADELYYAVKVDTKNDQTFRFGPAVPGLCLTTHSLETVWSNAARSRVIMEFSNGAYTSLWASNGESWWSLLLEFKHVWAVRVSPGRSLIWVEYRETVDPDDSDYLGAKLFSFDGHQLFERKPLPWGQTEFVAFGPNDKYLLWFRDQQQLVRLVDGQQQPFKTYNWSPSNTVISGHELAHQTFATSTILRDEQWQHQWYELNGAVLSVPGFDAAKLWRKGYQLDGNTLYQLRDRDLELTAQLPDSWIAEHAELSVMVPGYYAVAGSLNPQLDALDDTGALLGTYSPQAISSPVSVGKPYETLPQVRRFTPSSTRAVLIDVLHYIAQGDYIENQGRSYDVWQFDTLESHVHRLFSLTHPDDQPVPFQFSPERAALYWVADHRLYTFDLSSGQQREVPVSLWLESCPVEQRWSSSGS